MSPSNLPLSVGVPDSKVVRFSLAFLVLPRTCVLVTLSFQLNLTSKMRDASRPRFRMECWSLPTAHMERSLGTAALTCLTQHAILAPNRIVLKGHPWRRE